jgi:hypothetical protein
MWYSRILSSLAARERPGRAWFPCLKSISSAYTRKMCAMIHYNTTEANKLIWLKLLGVSLDLFDSIYAVATYTESLFGTASVGHCSVKSLVARRVIPGYF